MPTFLSKDDYNLNSELVDEQWFPISQSKKHINIATPAVRRMYRVGANGVRLEVWVSPNGSLITSHEAVRRYQIHRGI